MAGDSGDDPELNDSKSFVLTNYTNPQHLVLSDGYAPPISGYQPLVILFN